MAEHGRALVKMERTLELKGGEEEAGKRQL
jgi:hypothetical protein